MEPREIDIQLALLAELGANMRALSELENLYIAASIAGFGAVIWGMMGLNPAVFSKWPPIVVAITAISLAVAVHLKIYREHRRFAEFKQEQAAILKGLNVPGIPKSLTREAGAGPAASLWVMWTSAVGAVIFAASVAVFCKGC